MRGNQKTSNLELFNIFGSLCSIIALLIVLCAQLNWIKTIIIVASVILTIGLVGWLFVLSVTLYKAWCKDFFDYDGPPKTLNWLCGSIGMIAGSILLIYVFKFSFLLISWIVGLFSEMITNITT